MKRLSYLLLLLFSILPGCTKVEPIRTSGTDKIDNSRYFSTTYFLYGFSFSSAKLIPTFPEPGPDIIIDVIADIPLNRLTLQTNNLNPSFYKVGDFTDEASAKSAFDNLKNITVTQWADMADPLKINQVWIYRTGGEKYAKIRIINTVNETRQSLNYGECTFQWVFQPDGTLTFP
jgi:hypothetical protein